MKSDNKLIRKMSLILLILLSMTFVGCNSEETNENKYSIKQLYEANSEIIDELSLMLYECQLVYVEYGEIETAAAELTSYKCAYYAPTAPNDEVIIEYEDDMAAASLNNYLVSVDGSYIRVGNILFLANFVGYVFMYGTENLHFDGWGNDMWMELPSGKTILLSLGTSTIPTNNELIIDGYDILAVFSIIIWFSVSDYSYDIKKIIIGDQVEELKRNSLLSYHSCSLILGKNVRKINKTNSLVKYNYIIIPKGIDYIGPSGLYANIVYCEEKKKPNSWDPRYMKEVGNFYWAGQWEYDEISGEPKPIELNN